MKQCGLERWEGEGVNLRYMADVIAEEGIKPHSSPEEWESRVLQKAEEDITEERKDNPPADPDIRWEMEFLKGRVKGERPQAGLIVEEQSIKAPTFFERIKSVTSGVLEALRRKKPVKNPPPFPA